MERLQGLFLWFGGSSLGVIGSISFNGMVELVFYLLSILILLLTGYKILFCSDRESIFKHIKNLKNGTNN